MDGKGKRKGTLPWLKTCGKTSLYICPQSLKKSKWMSILKKNVERSFVKETHFTFKTKISQFCLSKCFSGHDYRRPIWSRKCPLPRPSSCSFPSGSLVAIPSLAPSYLTCLLSDAILKAASPRSLTCSSLLVSLQPVTLYHFNPYLFTVFISFTIYQ